MRGCDLRALTRTERLRRCQIVLRAGTQEKWKAATVAKRATPASSGDGQVSGYRVYQDLAVTSLD